MPSAWLSSARSSRAVVCFDGSVGGSEVIKPFNHVYDRRLEALPSVEGVHNRSRLAEGPLTENVTKKLYRGGAGIVPW